MKRLLQVSVAALIATFAIVAPTVAAAAAPAVDFVRDGSALSLAKGTGKWEPSEAGLRATGRNAILLGGQGVAEGDFRVTAELTIERLSGSAATFVLGDSHFGFSTKDDEFFLTGGRVLDGTHGTPVGKFAGHLSDGEPFTFEAERREDQLTFTVNGRPVCQRRVTRGPIGRIGFMPWRATMSVRSFRAEGNLSPELATFQPAETATVRRVEGVEKTVLLPPRPNNPRNSEGDFVTLNDGRVLFVYTHFTGGDGDHAEAHLAARVSADSGRTWSDRDALIVPNEGGWNVMSVSLLRLADGRIALFYLRKNSTKDCRPVMRTSVDEARTWSAPVEIIPDAEADYYVLNNDRVIQIQHGPYTGRLVAPLSQHSYANDEFPPGNVTCYISDDAGKTWRRSTSTLTHAADGKRVDFQEPGVVELKDGKLLTFIRTREGSQYLAESADGGTSWSAPRASEIRSPLSPASIERIPSTGDLLLAWNDHRNIAPDLLGKRTPYAVAISKDEGATWTNVKVLEDDPNGWYCYTAIHFVGEYVLLGHCAGNHRRGGGLNATQITRFKTDWLYD